MRSGGSPWTGPCSFNYWFGHYNGNLLFIDSTDHFTNKYNRQPFNLSNHLWGLPCTANDTAYEGVRMGLDSNNVLFKSFGFPIGPYAFGEYSQINRNSDTLFISGGVYHAVYKVGLEEHNTIIHHVLKGETPVFLPLIQKTIRLLVFSRTQLPFLQEHLFRNNMLSRFFQILL